MTWFVHCISKYPEEQQKLFDEVDAVFGDSDRPCSTQDVTELKYLVCCIKEALRLYPSVPGILRNLTEDVQIGKCAALAHGRPSAHSGLSTLQLPFCLFFLLLFTTFRCFQEVASSSTSL